MGFKLEDITDEFLSKVVFYEFGHPSGLGDTAGSITMLTADGREYFIAGESFEYSYGEWGKVFPVFDEVGLGGLGGRDGTNDSAIWCNAGGWRVFPVCAGDVAIRSDFAEAFKGCLQERGEGYVSPLAAAAKAMGFDLVEMCESRAVYDKTLEHWEYERRERARWKAYRERVSLGPDDVVWREIPRIASEYAGPGGCFTALHKRNDDGTFFTSVWSIQFQLDTDMRVDRTSRPGLYNLYFEKWVNAPLPVPCEIVDEETYFESRRSSKGFSQGENTDVAELRCMIVDERYFHDSGARFVRSFPTLREAKEGAMRRNACGGGWGGHTKENAVDAEGRFAYPMPEREEYRYDLAERPHAIICGKSSDTWLVRMRDEDTGEVVECEWSNEELSCIICEVPMSGAMPARASLLSIDPLSGADPHVDFDDPWR